MPTVNPDEIPTSEIERVHLVQLADVVQTEMPAARLVRYATQHGVEIRAQFTWGTYIEFFPSHDDAAAYLKQGIEQLRNNALRGLGLEPRIRAWEDEIRRLQWDNHLLAQQSQARAERIVELEEQLDRLTHPENYPDIDEEDL